MRDSSMHNILSNLDNIGKKTKQSLTESVNKDTAIKENPESTMRNLLKMMTSTDISRRLDEGVSHATPEGPKLKYMPGKHKMKKDTKKINSSNKFLVGGEEGEVPDDKDEKLEESGVNDYANLMRALEEWLDTYSETAQSSPGQETEWYYTLADIVGDHGGDNSSADYPDYMMGMEEARGRLQGDDRQNDDWEPAEDDYADKMDQDAFYRDQARDDDIEAHNYADDQDRADESSNKAVYEKYNPESGTFVSEEECCDDDELDESKDEELDEDSLGMKQSFADVFKSMDESDEDKASRLEKELCTELDEPKPLKKNEETGKYDLNDSNK